MIKPVSEMVKKYCPQRGHDKNCNISLCIHFEDKGMNSNNIHLGSCRLWRN